jgi:hypothetical protein
MVKCMVTESFIGLKNKLGTRGSLKMAYFTAMGLSIKRIKIKKEKMKLIKLLFDLVKEVGLNIRAHSRKTKSKELAKFISEMDDG